MSIKKMIPNILTVFRIIGVVIATGILFRGDLKSALIAMMVYILVAATDFFDGYLARKWNVVSAFGKLMDPIADKVYILTLYMSFVFLNVISHWWIWPIMIREVSVTIVRLKLLRQGKVVAAEKSGKIKTFAQNISVFLLYMLYMQIAFLIVENALFERSLFGVAYGVLIVVVFLTIQSGLDFYRNNWQAIVK